MPCWENNRISYEQIRLLPGIEDHIDKIKAEITKTFPDIKLAQINDKITFLKGRFCVTINPKTGEMWVTNEGTTTKAMINAIKRVNSSLAIKAAAKASTKSRLRQLSDNKYQLTMK